MISRYFWQIWGFLAAVDISVLALIVALVTLAVVTILLARSRRNP